MSTEIAKRDAGQEKGLVVRDSFGLSEKSSSAETAIAAVQAREMARINAAYISAERHPRQWLDVQVRLLDHCKRPGFAEVAWYKKPAGKKKINGQWVETYAEGLSARFAEVARQEMGNISTETTIVYEDHLARIVRATTLDLQHNTVDSREFTIAKFVEKRGEKKGDSWEPPKGREVISQRLNSYGEPTYLVVATDDEIRAKMNSEISKTTRDESLRLIPKDIRDLCAEKVNLVRNDPKAIDPTAARNKLINGFAELNVLPSDITTYMNTAVDKLSPAQINDLRGLYQAIRDGELTFNEALKAKYDTPQGTESEVERDIRNQRRTQEQEKLGMAEPSATAKPESEGAEAARPSGAEGASQSAPLTAEQNAELDLKLAGEEKQPPPPKRAPMVFGKGRK